MIGYWLFINICHQVRSHLIQVGLVMKLKLCWCSTMYKGPPASTKKNESLL